MTYSNVGNCDLEKAFDVLHAYRNLRDIDKVRIFEIVDRTLFSIKCGNDQQQMEQDINF